MGTSSSQMTPQTSDSDKNQGSCIENSVGEKVAYMDVSEFLFFFQVEYGLSYASMVLFGLAFAFLTVSAGFPQGFQTFWTF
jgi:hypothetical protein